MRKQHVTKANVKAQDGYLTVHLEFPVKMAYIIIGVILLLVVPEFWQAVQSVLSVIP